MEIETRSRSRSRSLIDKWEGWTTNRRKRSNKKDEDIDPIYQGKVSGLIPQWNNLLGGMNGRSISFRQYQEMVSSGKISFKKYQEQYPLVIRERRRTLSFNKPNM